MDRRYNEAEAALRKAISINNSPGHFWSELILVLQDIGQHDEAAKVKARMNTQASKESSLDSVTSSLNETRLENELQSPSHETTDARGMSPCIGCSAHTYYGCNQGEPCGKLIAYRSGASK
jgi:fumarylacetoacetate (FAA) hydrolase family protein